MKLHQGLMVITLTLTVMSGDLFAQGSDDRMFGNGRFLRRMKNEIVGKSKPDPKKKSPTKSDAKSKGKSPTPAARPAKSPTPATRAPANRSSNRPSQTYRPTPAKRPGSEYRAPQLDAPRVEGVLESAKRGSAPADLTRSARKPTFGFGMLLETKREQLVVTQLDPKGNAVDAGIKRGDVVVEAGGVEMKTMQEFNDVTDILEAGDQIEFVVLRKGKKDKLLIMHGKSPEQEAGDNETIEPAEPSTARTPSTRKYEFVPDPTDKNMKHVSRMPSVIAPSRQAYQSNRPVAQQPQRASAPRNVVEQQRLQIQQMQREIERLRRTNGGQSNQGTTNNAVLSGPDLSGPGQ